MLFFGSLLFAGVTSLISILEVIIAAVQDKLHWGRVVSTITVCVPMALLSIALFGTTTGLPMLDVLDKFVTNFGIVAVAFFSLVAMAIGKYLPALAEHINRTSSFKVGKMWVLVSGILTPVVLGYMLFSELTKIIKEGYENYPDWFVNTFGWGMAGGLIVLAIILSRLAWHGRDQAEENNHEQ